MARTRNNRPPAKKKRKETSARSKARAAKPSPTTAAKKAKRAKKARTAKPGIAVYRATLEHEPARVVAPRSHFEVAGPAAAAETGAALDLESEAAGFTFVAVVSHDGPWELRSLVVNDFQILDKTQPSSDLRIDVPIPAVFGGQLAINWSILAGHLIPGVATFVEPAGQAAKKLGEKAPLKKGESWAPLAPSTFP